MEKTQRSEAPPSFGRRKMRRHSFYCVVFSVKFSTFIQSSFNLLDFSSHLPLTGSLLTSCPDSAMTQWRHLQHHTVTHLLPLLLFHFLLLFLLLLPSTSFSCSSTTSFPPCSPPPSSPQPPATPSLPTPPLPSSSSSLPLLLSFSLFILTNLLFHI